MVPAAVRASNDAGDRIGDAAGRAAGTGGGRRHIRDRLGRMGLHTDIKLEARWKIRIGAQVELMLFIAVGESIFSIEVEIVKVAEREGVTLIGIVVKILRQHIVSVQFEMLAEAFSHAQSCATV